MRITSQNAKIKAALEQGRQLTPRDVLTPEFKHCMRLASRIHDLKRMFNMDIHKRMITQDGVSFAQYYL